jgi:hypothetical protein
MNEINLLGNPTEVRGNTRNHRVDEFMKKAYKNQIKRCIYKIFITRVFSFE